MARAALLALAILFGGGHVIPTDHHGRCHGVDRPGLLGISGRWACTPHGWTFIGGTTRG